MSSEESDQRLLQPGPSNSSTYGSISIPVQNERGLKVRAMAGFLPTKATARLATLSLFCGLGSFLWG
jgi:hypothetical protein